MALPPALLQSLANAPGFDRDDFVAVHESGEQVVSIRVNPDKPSEAQALNQAAQVPWCTHAYYLHSRPIFTADPLLHAGAYYVQEASSMFLWHVLSSIIGTNTNKKVLDLCAAPGGKSSLLLSYFKEGLVVSNEVIKSRVPILVENLTKWGAINSVITNNDPTHFGKLQQFFDVIVVDAPCSGSGLFRKDPSAINDWSIQHVELCSARQERILADVLPALTADGYLVYSTCSYALEEDEAIANWLIQEMDMESVDIQVSADWNIVRAAPAGFRFYPDKLKGEGFYMAVFRRKADKENNNYKVEVLVKPNKNEIDSIASFLALSNDFFYFKHQHDLRVFPATWQSELQTLAAYVYVKKAGAAIGALKGKDIVPAHEYALSTLTKPSTIHLDVDIETALAFLRKKDIHVNTIKGWQLITYQQLPLGWIKGLGNRTNNYYPAEWRIRKDAF